ncbi:MAG: hypothetical protein HYW49_00220 [Deltaproteobacteria bacterium]|nr:hypothetical protein [Deltaproteobacteria bacterium]
MRSLVRGYRNVFRTAVFALALAALSAVPARSQTNPKRALPVSEGEFRALAVELAPKVNLFSEIWALDPNAEFYGGTSRDYLYWVLRQFRGVESREAAEKVLRKLRAMGAIDVREFILEESDVDVVTKRKELSVKPGDFGIRKLDVLDPSIFDPKSELGWNELHQGYVPVEKVRVTRDGLKLTQGFADGVHEVYSGELTVHFAPADEFWKTKYALARENHPVLLALRYLRALAVDYYQRHGVDYPVAVAVDTVSESAVRDAVAQAKDGKALKPFFESERFATWFNASIQKAFRSYSNPTAALKLMQRFGVDELADLYREIEPFYNYLFVQKHDDRTVRANFEKYGIAPESVFQDLEKRLPERKLYHGTKSEEAFRSILLRGIVPSGRGTAGKGLYGVGQKNLGFAARWAKSKERVVMVTLKPDARLIDVTKGVGKKLWQAFGNDDFEAFAETFGADLIRYEYGAIEAFVLKNSGAIESAEGYARALKPFSEILEGAAHVRTYEDFKALVNEAGLFPRTKAEYAAILGVINDLGAILDEAATRPNPDLAEFLFSSHRNLKPALFERKPALKAEVERHVVASLERLKGTNTIRWLNKLKTAGLFENYTAADVNALLAREKKLMPLVFAKKMDPAFISLFKDPEGLLGLLEYCYDNKYDVNKGAYERSELAENFERKYGSGPTVPPDFLERLYRHAGKYDVYDQMDFLLDVPGFDYVGRIREACLKNGKDACLEFLRAKSQDSAASISLATRLLEHGDLPDKKIEAVLEDWFILRAFDDWDAKRVMKGLLSSPASLRLGVSSKILKQMWSRVLPFDLHAGDFTPEDLQAWSLQLLPGHWRNSFEFEAIVRDDIKRRGAWAYRKFAAFDPAAAKRLKKRSNGTASCAAKLRKSR